MTGEKAQSTIMTEAVATVEREPISLALGFNTRSAVSFIKKRHHRIVMYPKATIYSCNHGIIY